MACFHPLTAYYGPVNDKTGKRAIVFDKQRAFSGNPIKLPCGQCVGCRLEKSRQWAMRLMHELRFHKTAEFVTLTYNKENLPENMSLVKTDLQLFNKRVRKNFGPMRFYACGEYGSLNKRPHYHSIIFGLRLTDKKLFKRTKAGDLYESAKLRDVWGLGHVLTGDVTFDSCAYVARYICDKITGDMADSHYSYVDGDGVCHDRTPEFALMSRRPGIGSSYYARYKDEVYTHDNVIIKGKEVRPPRFYDTKFSAENPERFEALKKKRLQSIQVREQTLERRLVREQIAMAALRQKGTGSL